MLTLDELRRFDDMVERRARHEPVSRILGEREFWSMPFGLNEATLDPRPDSETLVEVAARILHEKPKPRILDLGTGSGCLLLALLYEVPDATGLGIDIAPRAVEQAEANAKRLELADRARFEVGNWLDNVEGKFDVVLSNPPYIPSGDIPGLMPEVRDHDPRRALDGGADGLDIYRLLTSRVRAVLKPDGFLMFEVGQGQAEDVASICRKAGMTGIVNYRDFNGVERCVVAWLQGADQAPL